MPKIYNHLTRWDLVHYAQQNGAQSSSLDQMNPQTMLSTDLVDQEIPSDKKYDLHQTNDTQENIPSWYKQFLSVDTSA